MQISPQKMQISLQKRAVQLVQSCVLAIALATRVGVENLAALLFATPHLSIGERALRLLHAYFDNNCQ